MNCPQTFAKIPTDQRELCERGCTIPILALETRVYVVDVGRRVVRQFLVAVRLVTIDIVLSYLPNVKYHKLFVRLAVE